MLSAVCTSASDPQAMSRKPTVVARAFPSVTLGDVQRDAVAGATELVSKGVLLVVGECVSGLDALDCQSLSVLPSLEGMVSGHARKWRIAHRVRHPISA